LTGIDIASFRPGGETTAGSEHDTQLIGPGNESGRQLRIVDGDRAGADNDGIGQRAEPMHVKDVFTTCHPL
jgi:hypothetical protein